MGGLWRFNPCEDCCDQPLNCGRCNFDDRPDQWIVDLGAGGWVDEHCEYCDQVAGQFTLDYSAHITTCSWRYNDDDVCDFILPGTPQTLDISLAYLGVAPDAWKWGLSVTISGFTSASSSAAYESASSTDADCFALGGTDSLDKITLTRISNTHIGIGGTEFQCSGTLPATIEIWVP